MIKILFICHGNICRSPMAEFVMRDLIKKEHLEQEISVASAATSTEEIGNDIHHGTKKKLMEQGIPFQKRQAIQIRKEDYDKYDYLIGMDQYNITNMKRIWKDPENKIHLLLEFAGVNRNIADTWYTGNFDETYDDILIGCQGLLRYLMINRLA